MNLLKKKIIQYIHEGMDQEAAIDKAMEETGLKEPETPSAPNEVTKTTEPVSKEDYMAARVPELIAQGLQQVEAETVAEGEWLAQNSEPGE